MPPHGTTRARGEAPASADRAEAGPTTRTAALRRRACAWCALALLAATSTGCASAPREEATASGYRMVRAGNIAIGGQPGPRQLPELRTLGYRGVISLCHEGEILWDEAAEARRAGLRFARVPVRAETIEVGVLVRIDAIIDGAEGRVLLYDVDGDRAALVWGMLAAGERSDREIIDTVRRAGLSESEIPRLERYLGDRAAGETRWQRSQ